MTPLLGGRSPPGPAPAASAMFVSGLRASVSQVGIDTRCVVPGADASQITVVISRA